MKPTSIRPLSCDVKSLARLTLSPCHLFTVSLAMILFGSLAVAEDKPKAEPIKHQITGLFSTEREADLRETFKELPEFKLVSIDFKNAEASFEYDPAKVFPNAKPEQIIERFDNLLREATRHTFGIKPLRSLPKDKLTLIEIPVVGLDCKGCCLGAYDAIYRLPGVEMATASFKLGRVTALVNPEKIDRVELETALKQRGVQLTTE
ncbi:MAG: heavy metal-associated domain-containing protein [Planctomycetaceae bacterium]